MIVSSLLGSLTAAQEPTVTFRSGAEAVTVSAVVKDRFGKVIKNHKKTDFELIDSGTARQITDFYSGDSAVSLAVVLDISGSMSISGNMNRAREAVNIALSSLQSGRDEAALYTFDSALQQVRP